MFFRASCFVNDQFSGRIIRSEAPVTNAPFYRYLHVVFGGKAPAIHEFGAYELSDFALLLWISSYHQCTISLLRVCKSIRSYPLPGASNS